MVQDLTALSNTYIRLTRNVVQWQSTCSAHDPWYHKEIIRKIINHGQQGFVTVNQGWFVFQKLTKMFQLTSVQYLRHFSRYTNGQVMKNMFYTGWRDSSAEDPSVIPRTHMRQLITGPNYSSTRAWFLSSIGSGTQIHIPTNRHVIK